MFLAHPLLCTAGVANRLLLSSHYCVLYFLMFLQEGIYREIRDYSCCNLLGGALPESVQPRCVNPLLSSSGRTEPPLEERRERSSPPIGHGRHSGDRQDRSGRDKREKKTHLSAFPPSNFVRSFELELAKARLSTLHPLRRP